MILSAIAAAAVAAMPNKCPVGAHVISAYAAELPLYDDAGATAVTIKPVKGVVSPPLLIVGCEDPYLFVQVDGRELAVERLSVRFDQPLAIPICDASVGGAKQGTGPQRTLGAMDHHCIEKKHDNPSKCVPGAGGRGEGTGKLAALNSGDAPVCEPNK